MLFQFFDAVWKQLVQALKSGSVSKQSTTDGISSGDFLDIGEPSSVDYYRYHWGSGPGPFY